MRNVILALPGLIWMAGTSFGATWFLQGTGDFDNPTTWKAGSNAGPNGVPLATDTLQFYGGDAPWPMWDADKTITLNADQTIAGWDQGYWHNTVRLNLNGHNFTNTGVNLHVVAQSDTANSGNTNYVSGGGTLTINGYSASGTAGSGFFLSGTGTKMVLNGDNGNLLGGSPGNEARFVVSGGATVTGTTTWASTRVGGHYSTTVPVSGIISLSDPGTRLDLNGGPLVVGDQGQGQLIVTNGAAFTTPGQINLGGWQYGGLAYDGTSGHGTVRVDGTGSILTSFVMDVGMYSTGVVQVVNGGTLSVTDWSRGMQLGSGYSTFIPGNGTNPAAYGILTVANVGSSANFNRLEVGMEGKGEVTVSDNATLAVAGHVFFKNSKLTVSDASVTLGGALTMAGSANTIRIELGAHNRFTAYIQAGLGLNLTAPTTLDLAVLGNFSAAVGQYFKLTGGPTTGAFSNYADQDIFTKGGYKFQITYDAIGTSRAGVGIYLTVLNNVAPTANNCTMGAQSGVQSTLQIIGGKYPPTDADGDTPLKVQAVNSTSGNATVTKDDNNVYYTPNNTFVGDDSFTYTVSDPYGGVSAAATVSVKVIANGAGFNCFAALTDEGGGKKGFKCLGIPGVCYALEYTCDLTAPVTWSAVSLLKADGNPDADNKVPADAQGTVSFIFNPALLSCPSTTLLRSKHVDGPCPLEP